jgi:hypothetical protein
VLTDPAPKLRAELEAAFTHAEYPVANPMESVSILPDGPSRMFGAGDVSISVMGFGAEYAAYQTYPYETADAPIDDPMRGFREEGLFD